MLSMNEILLLLLLRLFVADEYYESVLDSEIVKTLRSMDTKEILAKNIYKTYCHHYDAQICQKFTVESYQRLEFIIHSAPHEQVFIKQFPNSCHTAVDSLLAKYLMDARTH